MSAEQLPTRERRDPLFAVLLTCYGDHADLARRALGSLLATADLRTHCDVHVGCNGCCAETLKLVREALDLGHISTVIESTRNLHKSAMLRQMIELSRTPYVLVMDDDTHVRSGWLEALVEFIGTKAPLDLAGKHYYWDRSPMYQQAVEKRPWWRGREFIPPAQRERIRFCTGGFYLARTEFLRFHDYPDRGMVMQYEDTMLADLVYQVGGVLLEMPGEVLSKVSINDAERRWNWREGQNDTSIAGIDGAKLTTGPGELEDESARSLHERGLQYEQAGNAQPAEQCFRLSLDRDPQRDDARYHLAIVLTRQRKFAEAIPLYRRTIASDPKNSAAYTALAMALESLGRVDEAAEWRRKLLSLTSRDQPHGKVDLP
jgi:tetratricopeptide (TPR) repeat protein